MNSNPSKICSRKRPQRNERGIALISVLWVLLLLSSLAAAASYTARTHAVITHRTLEIAQAEAAADAAIVDTISRLSDEQLDRHPSVHGASFPWEFQGIHVTITVSSEAGRIDLNAADDDLLLAFLLSRALDQDAATALLSTLREWRHAGPLAATEELRQIPGWNEKNLDCWMDSLTVYTGLPGVSVADATPELLKALASAKLRQIGKHDWNRTPPEDTSTAAPRSVLGEVLRISSKATVSGDVSVHKIWVGRVTGDRRNPTLTLRWSDEPLISNSCPATPDL